MNGLDLLLVVLAVVAAVGGWRLGFVRRFAGWLGAGAGLGLAILVAPALLRRLDLASDLSVVLVVTALMVLLASIGQGIGALAGARVSQSVESPVVRGIDATGGMLLGIVAIAAMTWLVVPVMADAEGWPSASTRGSLLAGFVDRWLPEPPDQIRELERQLAGGASPQLFTGLREAPEIPAAPVGSPVSQATLDSVAPSAVRLQSNACSRIQSGSGFFVGDGLIVTNAHVVAGSTRTEITTADGAEAVGEVVSFDPATDLALLRTDLVRAALPIATPTRGDRGLVLGFPGGGPFEPSPFEVGQLIQARGYDIYDNTVVDRAVLALAAELEPGDSGSAVLRSDGSVIGVAVAVAPDRPEVAYALNSDELTTLLEGGTGSPVGTGPCAL